MSKEKSMGKFILALGLLITGINFAFGQTDIYDSIYVDQDWRTYNIHLPKGFKTNAKYALVFGFHGGQQAGRTEIGWRALPLQSLLSDKADKEGFIVVYPEGKEFVTGRSWNAGDCCPPSSSKGVDDVAFTKILLDSLFVKYPVDTTRVYATGTSNGAMFCYRLACELSHRIAAIAPNAASLMQQPCNPTKKVPIISFNSKIDPIVPYYGGFGPTGIPFLKDVYFPAQDSTLRIWSRANSCSQRDTIVNGKNNGFDFIRLRDCGCDAEVHHYATSDGGHSWPGGIPNDVSPVSKQLNATDLLWSFFQKYTLKCSTTGLENALETNTKMAAYPNPFSNKINLTNATGVENLTLMNCFGQFIWKGKNIDQQDFSALSPGLYYLIAEHQFIRMVKN